jgi:hypothetical protein
VPGAGCWVLVEAGWALDGYAVLGAGSGTGGWGCWSASRWFVLGGVGHAVVLGEVRLRRWLGNWPATRWFGARFGHRDGSGRGSGTGWFGKRPGVGESTLDRVAVRIGVE